MSTDLSKLKKGKGTPPAAGSAPDVIARDARRPDAGGTRPLQVRLPAEVFAEFGEAAAREFGFTHGAKKQLFLKMWDLYKAGTEKA